jgi:ABC-type multidrug transport system permease subunit
MYYTDIVRGAFLKGLGFEGLGIKLMILTVYTSVLLGLGFFWFRKRPKA